MSVMSQDGVHVPVLFAVIFNYINRVLTVGSTVHKTLPTLALVAYLEHTK